MTNLSYSEESTVTTRVRRRSERHLPFMPYGFVPLFGLLVLFWIGMGPFAKRIIEQTAIRSAEQTLAANGADWVRPVVSGQWVWLEGQPPTSMEGEQIIALMRAAQTPTWLGAAAPVTRVVERFGAPVITTTITRKPEWTFRLADGVLELNGNVPSETTRSSLVAAAEGLIDPPRIARVADFLTVTHVADDPAYSEVALKGIRAVGS